MWSPVKILKMALIAVGTIFVLYLLKLIPPLCDAGINILTWVKDLVRQ